MGETGLSEGVAAIEAARDDSRNRGFIAGLFEAQPRVELLHRFHLRKSDPEFRGYLGRFADTLAELVDPEEVDRTGELPDAAITAFRNMTAFALKVPKEYGGLGLTQSDYQELAVALGSWCGNSVAIISANNSLGASETLKQFGTEDQKRRWWPLMAAGSISGLALTEADAGTDVTNIATRAEPVYSDSGILKGWKLYGRKQWCTNAARSDTEFLADVLVIAARLPDAVRDGKPRKQYGAFIVPTDRPGISLIKRNRFSGLRALYNGDILLDGVFVPVQDRIRDAAKAARGGESDGLGIALSCITIGRLTLPAAALGGMKRILEMNRTWAGERSSMGHRLGDYQTIAQLVVRTAARTMALEAVTKLCGIWADEKLDLRIESGASKVLGTAWLHQAVDDLFIVRAGRAFETSQSLALRVGEKPWPAERMRRDEIINTIFEGANLALMLQAGREGNAELINLGMPGVPTGKRLSSAQRVAAAMVRALNPFGLSGPGLGDWDRRLARQSRRLTRDSFLAVARYQKSLERSNQLALADLGRRAMDIFAAYAVQAYAHHLTPDGSAPLAAELADWFCRDTFAPRTARRDIIPLARRIIAGEASWLERGTVTDITG
ncbi:MAG TPA: acyl-CoA dehydrogenase family protein [Candidatus Paceibacterota bacterium]|nr:acyl-CoA dehydrogenase family protein [Candidatus Paceibacterota bacterium]